MCGGNTVNLNVNKGIKTYISAVSKQDQLLITPHFLYRHHLFSDSHLSHCDRQAAAAQHIYIRINNYNSD